MDNQNVIDAINKRLEIVRADIVSNNLIQGDKSNSFTLRNVAFARWDICMNEEKFLTHLLYILGAE